VVFALLLATWRNGLRSGLQSRLSEFDSRRRLHNYFAIMKILLNSDCRRFIACISFLLFLFQLTSCSNDALVNTDYLNRQCEVDGSTWCTSVICESTGVRPSVSQMKERSKLVNLDVSSANIQNLNLSWSSAAYTNFCASNLSGSKLIGIDLAHSNLRGAELNAVDLRNATALFANFADVDLSSSNLMRSDFTLANFDRASLAHVRLRGSILFRSSLIGTDMRGVDLCGADLRYADLRGADLRHADLNGADLRWANLEGADLSDAKMVGADFRNALVGDALVAEKNRIHMASMPEWYYTQASDACFPIEFEWNTEGGSRETLNSRSRHDSDFEQDSGWDTDYEDFTPYWNGREQVECPEDSWGFEPCG
jgi:uncharacterized protein YjbI with pentapeptide repeats